MNLEDVASDCSEEDVKFGDILGVFIWETFGRDSLTDFRWKKSHSQPLGTYKTL